MKRYFFFIIFLFSIQCYGQKIVHYLITPPIHNPTSIDLDSNAVFEYNLSYGTELSGEPGHVIYTRLVKIVNTEGNFVSACGGILYHYFNGNKIDSTLPWFSYNGIPGAFGILGACGNGGGYQLCNGIYIIGIKFLINSDYHYGWIKYKLENSAYDFYIVEYAYHSIPNEPIRINSEYNSIEIIEPQTFEIFPNPANNKITLTNNGDLDKETVVNIFNIRGEHLLSSSFGNQSSTEIDISSLSKGVYLVKIQTEKGISTKKLVIQ